MVVFFFATVAVYEARLNAAVTVRNAEQTRLLEAAAGATAEALHRLGQDSAALDAMVGPPQIIEEDGIRVALWAERLPEGGVVVIARSGTGDLAQQHRRTVFPLPKATAANFVKVSRPATFGLPTILMRSLADWEAAPPAPDLFYQADGTLASTPGAFAQSLASPCADRRGRVYALHVKSGVDTGTVLVLDTSSGTWSALPPIPELFHDAAGNLVDAGSFELSGTLHTMTCDGERSLIVLRHRHGYDTVYRHDLAAGVWEILPQPTFEGVRRGFILDPGLDAAGNLYLRAGNVTRPWHELVRYDPDLDRVRVDRSLGLNTIFRLPAGAGDWEVLPEVPDLYYEDGRQSEGAEPAQSVISLAVTPQGELYAVSDRPGPNGILKFSGGAWSALPPPEKIWLQQDGTQVATGEDADVTLACTDGDGNLVLGSGTPDAIDSFYVYRGGRYQVLPPVPRMGYGPGGTLLHGPGYFQALTDPFGGAVEPREGQTFVPVSTY